MQLISIQAKPFLKWAGGKSQLLPQIISRLPAQLKQGRIRRYVEPFIGGGAVFFHIIQNYRIEESFISDANEELILAYRTIQQDVGTVIDQLKEFDSIYKKLVPEKQRTFYYELRERFNQQRSAINYTRYDTSWALRTAMIIFLNRTCFNGLFRVNARGEFNVPFGKYTLPTIYSEENLRAVSEILQRTQIHLGDFSECEYFVDGSTFVYCDPPYRPISKTSHFTAYSTYVFDDEAQLRLASFFRLLDKKGARLMLSNSDPKNENPHDDFFENAYRGFHIHRVRASRMINCNGNKRGAIYELLITNY